MAIDIDEGGTTSVPIDGASCQYVLSVVAEEGLEVSVYDNSSSELGELREALTTALTQRYQVVLLRVDAPPGRIGHWQVLEPDVFRSRLGKGPS